MTFNQNGVSIRNTFADVQNFQVHEFIENLKIGTDFA